jgi:hypothetical protein
MEALRGFVFRPLMVLLLLKIRGGQHLLSVVSLVFRAYLV